MGSTIYQRGEAAGQRKTLTRWLRKWFPEQADSLVARLEFASESVLDDVADLVAERLSDEQLLGKLDELLPRPDAAEEAE